MARGQTIGLRVIAQMLESAIDELDGLNGYPWPEIVAELRAAADRLDELETERVS